MLLHLDDDFGLLARLVRRDELQCVVNIGQMLGGEFDVENRSDNLNDPSNVVSHGVLESLLERSGAADDLGDLLRDLGLSGPVIGAREMFENIPGIVCSAFHRGTTSTMLGRRVFY